MIRPGVLVSGVLAVVLGCGLAAGALPALGATTVAAAPAGYAWNASVEVPGTAALNTSDAEVFSLSCASPGNCAAGGYYTAADNFQHPFVVDEVNGSWGAAQALPGSAAFNSTGSQVVAVSCPSAGDCEAVGGYFTAGVQRVFADQETGGVWGTATELPGTATLAAIDAYVEVRTLSCPSAGNCTAAGDYRDAAGHTQPFVADESDGTWGNAQELPVPANLASYDLGGGYNDNEVVSVSCASPGNCGAAGNSGNPLSSSYAWVANETNGTWGAAQQILGTAENGGTVASVSCGSASSCAAVGQYLTGPISNHAFVVDETTGTWGGAQELPGSAALDVQNNAGLTAVSCPSAGNCSAVGSYVDAAGRKKVLADSESGGVWATAAALPASAIPSIPNFTANPVLSCGSPGNCVAGGSYVDEGNDQYAFTVTQTGGKWGSPQTLSGVAATSAPMSQVTTVSCVPSGPCSMGGTYWDAARRLQAWVASQVPVTRTTLTPSVKSAGYGNEQIVHLSVAVAASSGTPNGTVTITAGAVTVCRVTLVAGAGGCVLTARQLQPGTAQLTAAYGGSRNFAASKSASGVGLTVTKDPTTTALGLSVAKAKYGKEQAVRITVAVRPRYSGTVAGKVRIRMGTVTVCTVTLSSAKGSCKLTARQLRAGRHILTAAYLASADFAGSVSAAKTLTIAK